MNSLGLRTRGPTAARSGNPSSWATIRSSMLRPYSRPPRGTCLAAFSSTCTELLHGAFGSVGPLTHRRSLGTARRGVVLGRGSDAQGGAIGGAGAHRDRRPHAGRAARHAALRLDRGAPGRRSRVVHSVPRLPPPRPPSRAPRGHRSLPALQRRVRHRLGRHAGTVPPLRGAQAGPPPRAPPHQRRAARRGGAPYRGSPHRAAAPQRPAPRPARAAGGQGDALIRALKRTLGLSCVLKDALGRALQGTHAPSRPFKPRLVGTHFLT